MTPVELFEVTLVTLGAFVLILFGLSAALSVATKLAARWRRRRTRWQRLQARAERAENLLAGAREREREARSLLDSSLRREKSLNNQLADLNGREHPFPDIAPADRSLADQFEAWLATNPTSED